MEPTRHICLDGHCIPVFGELSSEVKWRIIQAIRKQNGWEPFTYSEAQDVAAALEAAWNQRLCEIED